MTRKDDEGITTGPYDGPVKKEHRAIAMKCQKAQMVIKVGSLGSLVEYSIESIVVDRQTYLAWLTTIQTNLLWEST